MKILVIGHSVVDRIHFEDEVTSGPGGIYFSILGFRLVNPDIKISLLTTFTDENKKLFDEVYSEVDFSVNPAAEKMPVNHLYLKKDSERKEVYEFIPSKLNVTEVKNPDSYDGVYINLISGFEIGVNELYEIRKTFRCPVYLDIHTYSRGVDKNNQRFFRPIPHPEVWYGNVDFLQANESEILTFSSLEENRKEIVENILSVGVSAVITTRGRKGAEISYYEDEKKTYAFYDDSVVSNVPCVGCGDFFGAVFFSDWLKNRDFRRALKRSVEASGVFSLFGKDIKKLKKEIEERFD